MRASKCGPLRACVPICTTRPCFFAAATIVRPFEDVVAVGLLDVDVLAGLAGMNRRAAACQWSGVPITRASSDLSSSAWRKSLIASGRAAGLLFDLVDAAACSTPSSRSQTYFTSTSGSRRTC